MLLSKPFDFEQRLFATADDGSRANACPMTLSLQQLLRSGPHRRFPIQFSDLRYYISRAW